MNVNFFDWMRQGVKQSVLLGVSDAIETMGTPAETDDMHPGVLAFLQKDEGSAKKIGKTGGNRGGRKRLGKSLNDIES